MYDHHNVVICLYNGYSCGKFLSNILSYNKNFIPQFPLDGNRQAFYSNETYSKLSLEELQAIKHDTIMLTVPAKDETKNWFEYELGCSGFWGFWAGNLNAPINPKAQWLLNQKINCFFMTHTASDLQRAQEKFPNAKVIRLINDKIINALSKKLKLNSEINNRVSWEDLSLLDQYNFIDFDIGSIFNKDDFFKNIDQLLIDLGVTDRVLDVRVNEYYQKYCDLYSNLL